MTYEVFAAIGGADDYLQSFSLANTEGVVVDFPFQCMEREMARAYHKSDNTLSAAQVRELWDYDPKTGALHWRVSFRGIGRGAVAGKANPGGGRSITYAGRTYQATRIIWLHYYGVTPEGHVVPKNGDKSDLRIANLKDQPRSATVAGSKLRATNRSGYRGVGWNSRQQKWVASITRDYRRVHLGFYDTPEAASAVVEGTLARGLPEGKGSVLPRKPMQAPRKRWMTRKHAAASPGLVGFDSFEALLAEIGDAPSEDHVITRGDLMKAIGPGNVEWRLPWQKGGVKRRYHHAKSGFVDGMFERVLEEQGGVCAICRRPERQNKELSGDHDPVHGPRGVLCMTCNTALGLLDHNPLWLRAAADYLDAHLRQTSGNVVPLKKDTA